MDERVFLESIGGKQVFCVRSEPDAGRGAIVIMSHGFKGSSIGPAREFVDFSRLLVARGFEVLRFDQPNSGNSDGDFIDSSFAEWVGTIVHLVQTHQASGYAVCLLGQSMGATATVVAAARPELLGTIRCLLLWVPDPVPVFTGNPEQIYEEEGQRYRGQFWREAQEANFFAALNRYTGAIHLVYGDRDRFIPADVQERVIAKVQEKGGSHLILPGQGHSSWDFATCQEVYQHECLVLESVCPADRR